MLKISRHRDRTCAAESARKAKQLVSLLGKTCDIDPDSFATALTCVFAAASSMPPIAEQLQPGSPELTAKPHCAGFDGEPPADGSMSTRGRLKLRVNTLQSQLSKAKRCEAGRTYHRAARQPI